LSRLQTVAGVVSESSGGYVAQYQHNVVLTLQRSTFKRSTFKPSSLQHEWPLSTNTRVNNSSLLLSCNFTVNVEY
jgi:hypothetical protein